MATTGTSIDIKRCLGLIKKLQAEKQQLLQENNDLVQCKKENERQLQDFQKRYAELASKFETYANSKTTGLSVPIEEEALDESCLSQQNQSLHYHNKIKSLEGLLEHKNKEIEALQQRLKNINQQALETSKLKSFLQESKSLSLSYMTSLNELLSRYDGQGSDYCKETTRPQAVSGDQDVAAGPNVVPNNNLLQKELDRVKAENQELMSRLQPLQKLEAEQNSIVAQNNDLEEENKRLHTEISILSTAKAADFPIESQIKVFLDDFQDERKEKEQQYREKQEIFEENQKLGFENKRLKQKLESLSHCMTDLQHQMVEWSPPQVPSAAVQATGPAFQQRSLSMTRHPYPQNPSMDYPLLNETDAPAPYYVIPTATRPFHSAEYSGPVPLNRTPTPSETPRRIGFPPKDSLAMGTAPPPGRASDPTFAMGVVSPPVRTNDPNFSPHRSRPPLVSRQLANNPRPQFGPFSYIQESIQSDSFGDLRTLPKVPDYPR